MKDDFWLKEGAERGEPREPGEKEQHIGSRKTIDPPIETPIFRDLYHFGVEIYTILHGILPQMCFFVIFFPTVCI